MDRQNVFCRSLTAGLFGLVLSVSAWADPLAMVTDLSGSATANGAPLEILAELDQGTSISVAAESMVAVVYFDSGEAYNYNGPAEFAIESGGPRTVSGTEPDTESVLPEGEGAISTVGLAQAAIVMRAAPNEPKLTLKFPVETILLDKPRAFEWQPLDVDVGYSFELTDPEGRSVMETTVTGTRLDVPPKVDLIPGEFYTWSLETRLPDGRKFSNWASFSVADDALKEDVENRRPTDDSSVSRLVLYALWLEQNELVDEARRYWDKVSELRPEAARVEARVRGGG